MTDFSSFMLVASTRSFAYRFGACRRLEFVGHGEDPASELNALTFLT